MSDTIEIVVHRDGSMSHIYSDVSATMSKELGPIRIKRASYVEPDEHGNWFVDLQPVGGPVLGSYPPNCRDEALADEVAWLRENYLHIEEDVA